MCFGLLLIDGLDKQTNKGFWFGLVWLSLVPVGVLIQQSNELTNYLIQYLSLCLVIPQTNKQIE